MKYLLPILTLSLLAPATLCQAAPAYVGDSACKVANISGESDISVKWTGPCVDGYAHGAGVLDITAQKAELVHFEGSMQKGLMHGAGYLRRIGNEQYEGGFDRGRFHGFGISVRSSGRYDGEWKQGKREGKGKMIYTLGGKYEGEWKNNVFHGTGTARYITGREVTTEFVNGVRADQKPLPKPEAKYSVSSDYSIHAGSRIRGKSVHHGVVPFSESYAEMSEDDRATVRSWYALLDDGDEPPYPLEGTGAMYKAMASVVGRMQVDGLVHMFVDVDENGVATKASLYSTPDPEFGRIVMSIAMLQKYKPALCGGKPCAMKFPVSGKVGFN